MWSTFPTELVDGMSDNEYVLHAHSYSVGVETYNSFPNLRDFMKITQTDVYENEDGEVIDFIGSMEAYDYPIFSTMYHPEYQLLEFLGPRMWNLAENHTDT